MRRILLCLLIVMHALPSAAFLGNSKLYRYCVRNEWNSLVKRADSKDAFNHNKYQQSFYSFVEPCIDRIIKAHNMNALFAILKITNKNLTSNQIKSLIMADKINEIKFLVSTEKINLFYSVKLGDIYSLILKSNKAAEWTEFVLSLIAENNSEAKNKFIDINERLSSHKTFLGHFLEKGHIGAARLLIEAGASIYEALVYEYTKDHWMFIDIDEEQKQSLSEMLADKHPMIFCVFVNKCFIN